MDCRVIHPELRELFESKLNKENQNGDEEEPGENKQKKVRRGKFQDMWWNPTKRRLKWIPTMENICLMLRRINQKQQNVFI